jgi:putative oxidoreductase
MNNLTNLALLVLRLGASGMLLTHGIPKIQRLFSSPIEFPDPLGVGATTSLILALIGEVVGPLLVLIGYKTKLAAIPTIISMIVALLMIHFNDPFATKEKALLYLLLFVVIFLAGPGKYSVDKRY